MSRDWEEIVPAEERAIYSEAGYGSDVRPGRRPALLVVDATVNFTNRVGRPIRDSIKEFPDSCGFAAWESLEVIAALLERARAAGVPVIYTHGPVVKNKTSLGGWCLTRSQAGELGVDTVGESFVDKIKPTLEDVVLEKFRPSPFFGTPLGSILVGLERDTLVVCGGTTSGCVRAAVVDGFSFGFAMMIVEEGTFDRSVTSRRINLFEMNQKYGQILSLAETLLYLERAGGGNAGYKDDAEFGQGGMAPR